MNKRLLLLTPALLALLISGCSTGGDVPGQSNNSDTSSQVDPGSSSETDPKQDFTGVAFENVNVTYDGQPHILGEVTGAPENTTITYSGRVNHTDAGSYPATATLSKEGYNNKTLNATLVIAKGTMSGITFDDGEFEYDGQPHSISITGVPPSSAIVTYTSDVPGVNNSAIDIGVYNVTATISDSNYNTLELHATLTIKVNDDERYLAWSDDTLFFQNALDNNYLYAYNVGDNNIVRASKDNAVDIIKTTNDKATFVSKSAVSSSIKNVRYDDTEDKAIVENAYSAKARYVQYESDTVLYYVVNGLTQNKSGIYKVDLSGDEPVVTCLSVGKAKYLALAGNTLYFADGSNNDKLSSISTTGSNQVRTLVVDDKIKNLYYHNDNLYYTVNETLGDYIAKYMPASNKRVKLTSDAGIDFTFIGEDLFYINVDKFSTSIWGEGIYRVSKATGYDNPLPGTLVIESEQGICSLVGDGTYLYYYDMNGYKLIKAGTAGTVLADLLDGFVKPEDPTPLSLGSDMQVRNGILYYLDIWDEKTLHSYNPTTLANIRLTANKVDNFSIIGDKLYTNTVSKVISNSTYCYDLALGGDSVLINNYDGNDYVSDGTYLYYAQDNSGGVATAIRRTNLTTLEDEEIYNRGVSNLRLEGGKLYFIDNNKIYSLDTTTLVTTEIKPGGSSTNTSEFEIENSVIYYRDQYSLGTMKRLSRYNILTNEKTVMAQSSTDPISIVLHGDHVYYYTDTTSAANNGIYRVSKTASSTSAGSVVLACNSTYYAVTFDFVGDDIYFVNYKTGGLFGDSHLYKTDLSGTTPVKVA